MVSAEQLRPLEDRGTHDPTVIANFKKPLTWKNIDHEVPRWYAQWYNTLASDQLSFSIPVDD